MAQKEAAVMSRDSEKSSEQKRALESASALKGVRRGGRKKSAIAIIASLALVLAAAAGVYFLSDIIKPAEEEAPPAPSATSSAVRVVEKDKADIDRVTVKRRGEPAYTLINGDGQKYSVSGKPDFPVNQSMASAIAGYCSAMSATSLVEENVIDINKFGLTDPAVKVTMRYKDGSSDIWLFGDKVPAMSGYYIARENSGTVYTTYSSPYNAFDIPLNKLYALPALTPPTVDTIEHLIIEQAGLETIEIERIETNVTTLTLSAYQLVRPFVYDMHSERGYALLESVIEMYISGYAGERADLPDCGLDEPRARIKATGNDGTSVEFKIGAYIDPSSFYVQVNDTDAVFIASAQTFNFLNNAKATYLVDQFTNLVRIDYVDRLTIEAPGDKFVVDIRREPKLGESGEQEVNSSGVPQTIDTYYFDGEVTDTSLIKKLYQDVIGVLFSKTSGDYEISGDVAMRVEYTLNIEPGAYVVEYLTYDSEYYAVRVNDGPTIFLVKKGNVDIVISQANDYRAGTFTAR
jgi:hypothetical protein